MTEQKQTEGLLYYIRIQSSLDPKWAEWFDGFDLTSPVEGETLLCGRVTDQAALHGVLGRINSLGLPLLLVARADLLNLQQVCPVCGRAVNIHEGIH